MEKFTGELRKYYTEWLDSKGINSIEDYSRPLDVKYLKGYCYGDIFTFLLSHGYLDWVDRVLEELRVEYIRDKNSGTYYKTLAEFLQTKARNYEYSSDINNLEAVSKNSNPILYANYPSFYGTEPLLEVLDVNKEYKNNERRKDSLLEDIFRYSYFFDPQSVKSRFEKICKMIEYAKENQNKLKELKQLQKDKAQWKKCKENALKDIDISSVLYARGNKHSREDVLALKDSDGNRIVKEIIEKEFGYHTSGSTRNFHDYTISHLWGKANDPLFFSNLCNLALIPNWINHLMDKIKPEDTLDARKNNILVYHQKRSRIVNTILAVAFAIYDIKKLIEDKHASDFKITDFPIDTRFVEEGSFTLNIINKKGGKNKFDGEHGRIVKCNIKIQKKSGDNSLHIKVGKKEINIQPLWFSGIKKKDNKEENKTEKKNTKKYKKTIKLNESDLK